jgi:hypothetical protein
LRDRSFLDDAGALHLVLREDERQVLGIHAALHIAKFVLKKKKLFFVVQCTNNAPHGM